MELSVAPLLVFDNRYGFGIGRNGVRVGTGSAVSVDDTVLRVLP